MKAVKHKNGSVDLPGAAGRISNPSYRSFDEFIDVQRLRSLDGYLARRIERYIHTKAGDPVLDSACEISLTETPLGAPQLLPDLDRSDRWRRTEEALEFTMLMEFIETLPFRSMGRIVINYYGHDCPSTLQKDPQQAEISDDFIWFQTNLKKRFFLKSDQSGKKQYIDSYSAWFDTLNQHLGSDASDSFAFSVRVYGRFTDKFRREIAIPTVDLNRKSALLEELGK